MSELELRPASEAERAQIFAKVHEFWGRGYTLDAYIERCLHAPHMRRATWYLGRRQGEIVTSLGAHPTLFRLDEEPVLGISIASVHTRPQDRGRGFAPQLIQFVEQTEGASGARLSVLYSDIDPAYYARLGYQRAPAWRGWTKAQQTADLDAGGWRLTEFDGAAELPQMAELYATAHRGRAFSIKRTDEYWRMILAKRPHDRCYWLRDAHGTVAGYARLEAADGAYKITDLALAPEHEPKRELFYRLLIAEGTRLGSQRVGGWLPDIAAARACFDMEPRPVEITMAKPLDSRLRLSEAALAAADYFHEIDHV